MSRSEVEDGAPDELPSELSVSDRSFSKNPTSSSVAKYSSISAESGGMAEEAGAEVEPEAEEAEAATDAGSSTLMSAARVKRESVLEDEA
jgi:hypothetical protein